MDRLVKISFAMGLAILTVDVAHAVTLGPYAGAGLGYSELSVPNASRNPTLTNAAWNFYFLSPPTSTTSSNGGIGGRAFAGYNLNDFFGLEITYATYANSKSSFGGSTPLSNQFAGTNIQGEQTVEEDALSLVGKAYLPVKQSGLNVYGLLGVAEVFSQNKYSANGMVTSPPGDIVEYAPGVSETYRTRALRPTYGLGASYDFSQHLISSLEYSHIQGNGNLNLNPHAVPSADLVTLNLAYRFS